MTNRTKNAMKALFEVLNNVAKANKVNAASVSTALGFNIADITAVKNNSANLQAQAKEMNTIVIATAAFGPEIGAVYFEDLVSKLYSLLAQTIALTDGDMVATNKIISQLEDQFPYSFDKYASKFILSASDLFGVLIEIICYYIALFSTFIGAVSPTADVVATNSLVAVPAAGTIASNKASLDTLATTDIANLTLATVNLTTTLGTHVTTIKGVISNFALAVNKKIQINNIVRSFSELYNGLCETDGHKILMNAHKLENLSQEVTSLWTNAPAIDSGKLNDLKNNSEDVARYALNSEAPWFQGFLPIWLIITPSVIWATLLGFGWATCYHLGSIAKYTKQSANPSPVLARRNSAPAVLQTSNQPKGS